MSAWARPGVKCVCVDASPGKTPGLATLVTGRVYTIRTVEDCGQYGIGLILAEVRNATLFYTTGVSEPVYRVDRFRPLITRTQEQDVALFRQIIAQVPAGVDA